MTFIQIIILLGIILSCVMIYFMWKKQHGSKGQGKILHKGELKLENVGPGGVIHLTSVAEEMEDFDVNVLSKHIYKENGYSWYELEGDRGDKKVWIEYENDDELFISIKLRELKLRDIGVNKDDLRRIDDREEGHIIYNNEKFYYEDSEQAYFYRHGQETNGEKFYYWDFENDEGDKFISVERWGEGEYEVSYSVPLRSSQITVYSISK